MKGTFLVINFLLVLVTQAQKIEKKKKQDAQSIKTESTNSYEKKEPIKGTSDYLRVLKNGNWGVINKNGKRITPIKYEYVTSFSEGLIWVALNGKYGVIDTLGKEITPIKYEAFFGFDNGFAAVNVGKKYGYINSRGKEITPIQYESFFSFSNGCCPVGLNGKYGFINEVGRIIIPIQYDMADISYGIPKVYLNKRKIYFTNKGKELPSFSKYDEVYPLSNGLLTVRLNGKYGYVNIDGMEVIPVQFEHAFNFEDSGFALVSLNGKSFYINKKGEKVEK